MTITIVVTAVFMTNLDLWIVNVALVDIGRDLNSSLSGVSWVLNAYAVTLAAVLIPAGRLGDRIGHRQVFLIGIAVFTLASVACAAAPNIVFLVIARVAQAAGAAAQLPTSLALLLASVEPSRRMSAARGWAAVGAMAAVAGPVLGGLLVTISWRWIFVVNLPVGLIAWIAGRRVLPQLPAHEREPMPDPVASALLIIGVGTLTGALVEAPSWGWAAPRTMAMVLVSLLALAMFVHRCRTHPAPMVELAMLRIRRFATANSAAFLFSVAFAIMLLSNALWCQEIWHYSAMRTGLAMVPGPGMVPFVTYASIPLVRRIGPGRVAALGSLLFAVSMMWRVVFAEPGRDYARDLLPSMLLGGIAVGLALGTLIAAAATALPPQRAATASAIVNSGRQVASALGVALLVTILDAVTDPIHAYQISWVIAAAVAIGAGAASLALPHASDAVQAPLPVTEGVTA